MKMKMKSETNHKKAERLNSPYQSLLTLSQELEENLNRYRLLRKIFERKPPYYTERNLWPL